MPHVAHQNPDGLWIHFCTECQSGLKKPRETRHVAWVCKCVKQHAIQGPTVTIGRTTAPAKTRRSAAPKLGDRIESALQGVGVTKDLWIAFKAAMGLPATCNCDARKQYLNSLGDELGEVARKAVASIVGG
jgi:hypothetical protein